MDISPDHPLLKLSARRPTQARPSPAKPKPKHQPRPNKLRARRSRLLAGRHRRPRPTSNGHKAPTAHRSSSRKTPSHPTDSARSSVSAAGHALQHAKHALRRGASAIRPPNRPAHDRVSAERLRKEAEMQSAAQRRADSRRFTAPPPRAVRKRPQPSAAAQAAMAGKQRAFLAKFAKFKRKVRSHRTTNTQNSLRLDWLQQHRRLSAQLTKREEELANWLEDTRQRVASARMHSEWHSCIEQLNSQMRDIDEQTVKEHDAVRLPLSRLREIVRFLRHKRRQSVRSGRKRGHMDDKADNTIDDARAAGKLLLANYSEFHEELGKDLEEEEADLSASVDALRRRIAKADAKEPMQNASSRGPTQRESAPVVGDLQAIRVHSLGANTGLPMPPNDKGLGGPVDRCFARMRAVEYRAAADLADLEAKCRSQLQKLSSGGTHERENSSPRRNVSDTGAETAAVSSQEFETKTTVDPAAGADSRPGSSRSNRNSDSGDDVAASGGGDSDGDDVVDKQAPHSASVHSGSGSVVSFMTAAEYKHFAQQVTFLQRSFSTATGGQTKTRAYLVNSLKTIFPQWTVNELRDALHSVEQEQYRRRHTAAIKRQFKRERDDIIKTAQHQMTQLQREADEAYLKEAEWVQLELHRKHTEEKLQALREEKSTQQQERHAQEAALAEEMQRIAEKQRMLRDRHVKRLKRRLEAHAKQRAEQQLLEQERMRQEQALLEEQKAKEQHHNRRRVKYRSELTQQRLEELERKKEEEKRRIEEREERLDRLRSQVAVSVTHDPNRLLRHTESYTAGMEADEASPLFTVHGYNNDELFADPRFRLQFALNARGLGSSAYARTVLRSTAPARPPRRDASSSIFKAPKASSSSKHTR